VPGDRRTASARESVVARNYKLVRKTGVGRCFFLVYLTNAGETRAELEFRAQVRELLGGPAGEDLHAAVLEIAHITAQMQFRGGMLREVAISHTLNGAGDKVSLGLLRLAHGK